MYEWPHADGLGWTAGGLGMIWDGVDAVKRAEHLAVRGRATESSMAAATSLSPQASFMMDRSNEVLRTVPATV